MPPEPGPITLAQVIHHAVELCDPAGTDENLAELFLRLVNADEPITAIEDIEQRLAESAGALDPQGEVPSVQVATGAATHLAFRREQVHKDGQELSGTRHERNSTATHSRQSPIGGWSRGVRLRG